MSCVLKVQAQIKQGNHVVYSTAHVYSLPPKINKNKFIELKALLKLLLGFNS